MLLLLWNLLLFTALTSSNFLSSSEGLLPFKPLVYCLNPKTVANYRKSFVDMDKTDPLDAYVIADFARCGRITSSPWRGGLSFLHFKGLLGIGFI